MDNPWRNTSKTINMKIQKSSQLFTTFINQLTYRLNTFIHVQDVPSTGSRRVNLIDSTKGVSISYVYFLCFYFSGLKTNYFRQDWFIYFPDK